MRRRLRRRSARAGANAVWFRRRMVMVPRPHGTRRTREAPAASRTHGPAPAWDTLESDPVRASCLRTPDGYNDWAWRGIEPLDP